MMSRPARGPRHRRRRPEGARLRLRPAARLRRARRDLRTSDAHGRLAVAAATNRLALGDKIRLIPGHCDPTVTTSTTGMSASAPTASSSSGRSPRGGRFIKCVDWPYRKPARCDLSERTHPAANTWSDQRPTSTSSPHMIQAGPKQRDSRSSRQWVNRIYCSRAGVVVSFAAAPGRVNMSQFLLIHGAFHGAWCWHKAIPELEKHGNRAQAIDLPGQGQDQTPLGNVTLDTMVDRIVTALTTLAGPVGLVGHSLAGMVISATAEKAPDRSQPVRFSTALSRAT